LLGVREAMGETVWTEYVCLMESLIRREVDDKHFDLKENKLFQTFPSVRRIVKKLAFDMVAEVLLAKE